MIKYLFLILFIGLQFSWAQNIYLKNEWQTIGPLEEPSSDSRKSSRGIGPVEFIRASATQKGLLLVGSLNGGLFFTKNGGDLWENAGSDYWPYSTATWADFYPTNSDIWFAGSHERESNGKPGRLGEYGGLYRTFNQGKEWELIASHQNFNGNKSIKIYKTVFNPNNPKELFVLTSDDIYYTHNCLDQKNVNWEKVAGVKGMMYDMLFINNVAFITSQQFGKWHLSKLENGKITTIKAIDDFSTSILNMTLAKQDNELLLLVDYKSGPDKLYRYSPQLDKLEELSRSQKVTFGAGRNFNVNPKSPNEIYLGSSMRLRRWNSNTKKFENLNSKYHVDVEFIEFDPFDENALLMATHGGVYISYDKGASWVNKSKGLGICEVMGMDVGRSDPDQVALGAFHDGSMVYADWQKDGNYYWENVNGGDALIPFINPVNAAEVYTSNQYDGGGIYYSSDTAKTNINIHSRNGLRTSGWQMAACFHPIQHNVLFFNHWHKNGDNKGNINVVRTADASKRNTAEEISDFRESHGLESYKVYSLFNSKYHPDLLLAYVLHYTKDEKGKSIIQHKLFRTSMALDSAQKVKHSWVELEVPHKSWIGDVVIDKKNKNKLYFAYMGGVVAPKELPDETGMVYHAKYRKKNNRLKRSTDISINIPSDRGGKYNMAYLYDNNKIVFVGTRSGVYMGTKATLGGFKNWKLVGEGLPHCMVYGLDYNEKNNRLTVGLKGRGVWILSLNEIILE